MKAGLDEANRDHLQGILTFFFKRPRVLACLAPLIDPRPNAPIDTRRLEAELAEAGFDPSTLPEFRPDEFFRCFRTAFYLAVKEKGPLQPILQLDLLEKVLQETDAIAKGQAQSTAAYEQVLELLRVNLDIPHWSTVSAVWAQEEETVLARLRAHSLAGRPSLAAVPLAALWKGFLGAAPWHDVVRNCIDEVLASDRPGPLTLQMCDRLAKVDMNLSYLPMIEKIRGAFPTRVETEIADAIRELEGSPDQPASPLLRSRRSLQARVRALRSVIDDQQFHRCLLLCGGIGAGKTHFTAFLETEDLSSAGPGWRCLLLPLDRPSSPLSLEDEILSEVNRRTSRQWSSLAEFDRFLVEAPWHFVYGTCRLIVVLDDLQRWIVTRGPDFLAELTGLIADRTALHSLMWILAIQDTTYDRLSALKDKAFWRRFSATPDTVAERRRRAEIVAFGTGDLPTIGSWAYLDDINVRETLGLRLIREHAPKTATEELRLLLEQAGSEQIRSLMNPQIAWILLDSNDERLFSRLINLHFVEFVQKFWDQRWARLERTGLLPKGFSEVQFRQTLSLLVGALVELAQARPDRIELEAAMYERALRLVNRDLRDQSTAGLEALLNAGLLAFEPYTGGPLGAGERLSLRSSFFWCYKLAEQLEAHGSLGLDLETWLGRLGDAELAEGTLEFLLLLSDSRANRDPVFEDLWLRVMTSPGLPQCAGWLAAAKGSDGSQRRAAGFARKPGVRRGSSRNVFSFLYFLSEARTVSLPFPERFRLLQPLFGDIAGAGLQHYLLFLLRRFFSEMGKKDWIDACLDLQGCEALDITEEIGDVAGGAAFRLCSKDAETALRFLLGYLRDVGPRSQREISPSPWRRRFFREWLLASVLKRAADDFAKRRATAVDLFRKLVELDWYHPKRLKISRHVGQAMDREANIVIGKFYRDRSNVEGRELFHGLIAELVRGGDTKSRKLAFFLSRHTQPAFGGQPVAIASPFLESLKTIYLDPQLQYFVQQPSFQRDFQATFAQDFPRLERLRIKKLES